MKSALRSGVDGMVLFARLALEVLKEKISTRRRGGRNIVCVSFWHYKERTWLPKRSSEGKQL